MSPTDTDSPTPPPAAAMGLLVVGLVAIVVWALPRHVQPGDAGEFATILLRGGVPHPPGYPWMRALYPVAWFGAWCGLPAATAAALPCATLGVAGWCWLGRSAARLCPWPIALGTAAFVGSAHVVVVHGTDSEVWGPLVFATAAIVHLALGRRRAPGWIGLAFGAALGVHLTILWLFPLVVVAAWPPGPRPSGATIARHALLGASGTAAGLMIFATVAVGDTDAPWRWGQLDTVTGVLRHVARSDYGTFRLSLHADDPDAAAQLGRAASSWVRAWSAGLLGHAAWAAVLLAAIAAGVRAGWPRTHRGFGVALAAAWVLAAVVFPLLHDIDPTSPFGAWILERFDVMPLALSVIPIAVAVTAAARTLGSPRRRLLARITAGALFAQQIATTAAAGVPADDDAIEVYAIDVLRTPDPAAPAIVLGTDDHRSFAVLFAQAVLGEGPDVLYIDASLLAHAWYRAALRRRMPALPDEDLPVRMLGRLWAEPAGRDIAVYLANDFSIPSTSLPRVPQGVLWRVLPPESLAITPDEVVARHLAARGRLAGPPAAAHTPFAADVAAAWGEPDRRLRRALAAAGRADLLALLPAPEPWPDSPQPHATP